MLTKKQLELLIFINDRIKIGSISPSFEEMREALNLKSKSGIHRLISGLEERGFIERLPHRARAINVIKKPESINNNQNNNVEKNLANEILIYGKIAAGTPIEAIETPEGYLSVPKSMINNTSSYYALEVAGESMKDAGILNGDIAILEKINYAVNGDIVVALIDNQEATLKRFRKKSNSIALEPANSKFETRIFGLGRVEIQGKLVGIIRNY